MKRKERPLLYSIWPTFSCSVRGFGNISWYFCFIALKIEIEPKCLTIKKIHGLLQVNSQIVHTLLKWRNVHVWAQKLFIYDAIDFMNIGYHFPNILLFSSNYIPSLQFQKLQWIRKPWLHYVNDYGQWKRSLAMKLIPLTLPKGKGLPKEEMEIA